MSHIEPKRIKQHFFTNGTLVLFAFMAIGYSFAIVRLLTGLGTVTNLDNHNPWGIWIAFDVACGVALAAGGFTTAALVDIFGRKKYHSLLRPAILTALIGYVWVAIALLFDLGRYWNIWQPMFNWQGNSVMFELAMCVMAYLFVLSIELYPSIYEGIQERIEKNEIGAEILKKIEKPLLIIYTWVKTILPLFIVAGVVLSFMHQSSLGTMMMIAQTKMSTLWYTPILPLLFLLSAIMVGFPMVVIESIITSVSFNREVEIDVLSGIAKKIPWFLGVYGVLKLGDLLIRFDQLNFIESPISIVALTIEIVIGIIVPFILLNNKLIRSSSGWLFFSSVLVVIGVILNRINVFLVAYNPPFSQQGYFPSIGEIFLTIAIICSIMFLFRFFVIFFPILPADVEDNNAWASEIAEKIEDVVTPFWTWVIRGSAAVILLLFIFLYVVVHQEAIELSTKSYKPNQVTGKIGQTQIKDVSTTHKYRPKNYKNYYILNNPILNTKANYYEPVRFSHRTHDVNVGSDCSICHHRVSSDPSDKVGEDMKEMHSDMDIRIGGPCVGCHVNITKKEFNKCSSCHLFPNEKDYPARIGLKGAYHRQCIGCHDQQVATLNAPVDCKSCHYPLTPDHSKFLTVSKNESPDALTGKCLKCHKDVGEDILKTAHWNWEGQTPGISGYEHNIDMNLSKIIDNYTISMLPRLVNTRSFHISYSTENGLFNSLNLNNIDCLVCHDTTGLYKKKEASRGIPIPGVNLTQIVNKIGRPSNSNCGQCHFHMGDGTNIKHGDLEPDMINPDSKIDIHMGLVRMRCQDCHTTTAHKIAGMSFNAPVTEGRTICETCHGNQPHGITGFLSRHLDDHVRAIACETCHIPFIAKKSPTRLFTNFSKAGQNRPERKGRYGMTIYDKKIGSMRWGKYVIPEYCWFDGNRKSYVLGDGIDPSKEIELNPPIGEKHLPESRIFPFKVHQAIQPYDIKNKILVPVKFNDGYWNHFDWNRAIKEGMKAVGLKYSGKFGFARTRMYTSIHHEVVKAKLALGCSDCHSIRAVTCVRCHKNAAGMDQPSHTRKVYPRVKNRINFQKLGYKNDPAFIGGRFYKRLGRGRPPK